MGTLREHQVALRDRARDIADGRIEARQTVAAITPGGGKTLGATIFARALLDAGVVERVVWVCPRSSLALQSAEGFRDVEHNPGRYLRRAENVSPLVRDVELGTVGYTTTYQAVAKRPDLHEREVKQHPTLVILDEPHHLADAGEDGDGKAWTRAVERLVKHAVHVLLMTGTIERHDDARIPLIEYETRDGRAYPRVDIEYTRRAALRERAVLPIEFSFSDGWTHFRTSSGEHNVEIGGADSETVRKVIATFLSRPEYRDELVRRCLDDWQRRCEASHASRAIVVCASQSMARDVAGFIGENYRGAAVALAISDDARSQKIIEAFRHKRGGRVLVTVGMAYEGLDVPDVTHLACLTNTRSRAWLDQAFNRATRVDPAAVAEGIGYESQSARIYVPKDPLMVAVVESMREDIARGVAERALAPEGPAREPMGAAIPEVFVPLGAGAGAVTLGSIDGQLTVEQSRVVAAVRTEFPSLTSVPAHDVLRIAERMGLGATRPPTQPAAPPPVDDAASRSNINRAASEVDRRNGWQFGTANRMALRHFGKPRGEMGTADLAAVAAYLHALVRDDSETA